MAAEPEATIDRDALVRAIEESSSYRLAHEDMAFLASADLRPVRLQLELLKPEHDLRGQGINSTVRSRGAPISWW